MKMRRERLDNKGAALVTILIAVTFMTIMASSLMYMAYMNYLTKSMRYSATDNFYTDEFALDDLSTHLQQIAAESADIDSAKRAIVDAVCGNGGGVPSYLGPWKIYDFECVKNQIQLAGQEASISVNCALINETGVLPENALIVEDNYITLKGLMITATTAEGYQSTITADVTISFPNTLPGSMDLNDFSVMSDSPMLFTNGGSHYYSGNMYVQSREDEHGNRPAAIQLDNGSAVGILSPNAMVVGDIEIKGRSVLHITGDMTVYGNIEVEAGSVLICSGTLRHEGISGTGELKGNVNRTAQTIDKHQYLQDLLDGNEGLVGSLFQEVYIYGFYTDNASLRDWTKWTLEDYSKLNINQQLSDSGINCWVLGQHHQTYNAAPEYDNALIMSTQDLIFNGTFENTTVLTTGTIEYRTTQGTTYMTRMADDDYEAAKDMIFHIGNDQLQVRVDPDNPDSSYANFKAYFGNSPISDSAVAEEYRPADHGDPTDERVFKMDSSEKNYFPVGYFIVEDASDRISKIMSAPSSQQDPAISYITYELWSKD